MHTFIPAWAPKRARNALGPTLSAQPELVHRVSLALALQHRANTRALTHLRGLLLKLQDQVRLLETQLATARTPPSVILYNQSAPTDCPRCGGRQTLIRTKAGFKCRIRSCQHIIPVAKGDQ